MLTNYYKYVELYTIKNSTQVMALDYSYVKAPPHHRIEDTPTGQFYIFYGNDGELALAQNALEINEEGILLRTFKQPKQDFASTWTYGSEAERQHFYAISDHHKSKLLEMTKSLKEHKFKLLRQEECIKELVVDCYRCKFIIADNYVLSDDFDVSFMLKKKFKLINQELSNQRKDFNVQFKILIYAVFDICEEVICFLPYRTQFCDLAAFFLFLVISQSETAFDYDVIVSKAKRIMLAFLYNNKRLLEHFENLSKLENCVRREMRKEICEFLRMKAAVHQDSSDTSADSSLILARQAMLWKTIADDEVYSKPVVNKVFQLVSQFFTRYLNPDLTLRCICEVAQLEALERASGMICMAVKALMARMLQVSVDGSDQEAIERILEAINDLSHLDADEVFQKE